MTYEEVKMLIEHGDAERGYRESWSYGFTNHHIFLDGNIKVTTCDWPQPYFPTKEDLKANDWVIIKKIKN